MPNSVHKLIQVDNSWTLFLDRDGVINTKLEDDYVKYLSEFNILPGVTESIYYFSTIFNRIIIVTNQQGIAKGVMTESSLHLIHNYLFHEVENAHGKIDAIYFCPHSKDFCTCRKPQIGMALFAKDDYPEIEFTKSIMIGDSISDMEFGKNCGMITVKIGNTIPQVSSLIDIFVPDLLTFSKLLKNYLKHA